MFDPNKYDNSTKNSANTYNNQRTESFMDKRDKLIKWLKDFRPLMVEECESMERRIEQDPTANYVSPFNEKLEGWSKIINGIDIIDRMYIRNN